MASWIREVYQNKFSRIKLTTVTQWPYLTVSDGCQYQGTGYVKYLLRSIDHSSLVGVEITAYLTLELCVHHDWQLILGVYLSCTGDKVKPKNEPPTDSTTILCDLTFRVRKGGIRLQNTCQLFQWFAKAKAMGQECRLHLSKAQRPEKQEKGRKLTS